MTTTTPLTLTADQSSCAELALLGGKAANLAWLTANNLPVPVWFVVTTAAFDVQMAYLGINEWIDGCLSTADIDPTQVKVIATEIQQRILEGQLSPAIRHELENQIHELSCSCSDHTPFAVRSSAVDEDGDKTSFAGQLDSYLYQFGIDQIQRAVLQVFASTFNERAIRYRQHHQLPLDNAKAAVIVQEMIPGDISGVMFTAHPGNGSRQHALISAGLGLGEGVVSGEADTDEFTVSLYHSTIERQITDKRSKIVFDREQGFGTKVVDVDPSARQVPCLSDQQIATIKHLGLSIAEDRNQPQDIEWTIADGKAYILQTRPITSLPPPQQPQGDSIVWDNSNIQESYCGVTSPLSFSYALRMYGNIYRQTGHTIGIPKRRIDAASEAIDHLLGHINGRVYYNINNWYRGLLLMPGFKTNKSDMERMMGLQDPVDLVEAKELSILEIAARIPESLITLYKLYSGFRTIEARVDVFHQFFDTLYKRVNRQQLHTLSIAELMRLSLEIQRDFTHNWQTPIINDTYVMTMNGRVHRWLEKLEIENPDSIQNNLMSGEEGIESTEPTKMLLSFCDDIRTDNALADTIHSTENRQLLVRLKKNHPVFGKKCLDYIERYGDRCIGEMKLESISLRQDASFMFAVIKNFLKRDDLRLDTLASNEAQFRHEAETLVFEAAKRKLSQAKMTKFKKDLQCLRQAVKNRENMRLARTRATGIMRDIYVEVGKQLAFYGLLNDERDIFYLTVDELDAYMSGTCSQSQFKPLVASRQAEFLQYEEQELPHHFETVGPVYHHNLYQYTGQLPQQQSGETLTGIGCYPGKLEGNIRLIFSPDDEMSLDGDILCTVRTDPGWAPLFPTAGGIIVERGSTLSHSAVVARELGIPAIVNIPGLTKTVTDGERVMMDGSTGIIQRLSAEGVSNEAQSTTGQQTLANEREPTHDQLAEKAKL